MKTVKRLTAKNGKKVYSAQLDIFGDVLVKYAFDKDCPKKRTHTRIRKEKVRQKTRNYLYISGLFRSYLMISIHLLIITKKKVKERKIHVS